MPYELITRLLGFPDFRIVDIEKEEESVVLTIEREKKTFRCGACGKEGLPGYDHRIQEVRHLLWWEHPTVIRFPHYRVLCPLCGVVTEELDYDSPQNLDSVITPYHTVQILGTIIPHCLFIRFDA